MKTFEHSLAIAQQTVQGIDTRDISSLAYVSSLVALETILPTGSAAEIDFMVSIEADGSVTVDLGETNIVEATRDTINLVASHYFQARLSNVPVSVH